MTEAGTSADPRAQWRTLPTPVPPEAITTGQAVDPLPEAILDDRFRSALRQATEAGG